ncbi:cytochrome c oxidase assembly protein [Streptomyces sp. NPDC050759]|uniref:cytochrome c oxidase assembly protein n=1 Tax=Streptomyces sp. NPDC050759 TaxID=3365635 RepID=UPI00378DD450
MEAPERRRRELPPCRALAGGVVGTLSGRTDHAVPAPATRPPFGLLFFWVVIGIDPGPRRPPHLGRLFVPILTMPLHSWFSISLVSSTALIGEGWWSALDRPWLEYPMDGQYDAGAIAWATGDIPVLITTIILAVQWVRSDQREARRVDRQIDPRRPQRPARRLKRLPGEPARPRPATRPSLHAHSHRGTMSKLKKNLIAAAVLMAGFALAIGS